jgi:quinol monooxygenase YgiN
MSGIRLVCHSIFEPGRAAEFVDAWNERAAETRNEPGCVQYEVLVSREDPDRIVLLEHWTDQETYDRHWALEQTRGPWPGEDATREFTIEIYDDHALWELGEDMTWRLRAS